MQQTACEENTMVSETQERKLNIDAKIKNDGIKRMPHERDEAPDGQDVAPRGIIEQAASDLEQGLVDTDMYSARGDTDAIPDDAGGQAKPQEDANKGMRRHDSVVKSQGGDDNDVA
jgi:hypothetical protein